MAGLALGLALLALILLGPAGSPARATTVHRSACPAQMKHGKHPARATRCSRRVSSHAKRRSQKHRQVKKRLTHTTLPATPATPALCEDGSMPVAGAGEFTCGDGSEPGCEDGSEPTQSAIGTAPLCPAEEDPSVEAPDGQCEPEDECQTVEWNCEESAKAGEAAAACERAGGGEGDS